MRAITIGVVSAALLTSQTVLADEATPHPVEAPSGGAGIRFGTSRAAVLKTKGCTAESEGYVQCQIGESVLGFTAAALVDVCVCVVCSVLVSQVRRTDTTDQAWLGKLVDLERRIEAKYGKPDAEPAMPDSCASDAAAFVACIRAGTYDSTTTWWWKGDRPSRIVLDASAHADGSEMISVFYQSNASIRAVQAKRQRQADAL